MVINDLYLSTIIKLTSWQMNELAVY